MDVQADLREALQIFDVLPTGILLLDPEGAVLRYNHLAEERLGMSGPELLGRDLFTEVFPELEREGLGWEYRRQMAHAAVALEREGRVRGSGGELHLWLGFRSFAFKHSVWGLVVVEDRDALAQEEERRRRAERMASVGELAAGMAHEVNNPLASIKSFAELLMRDALDDDQRRALGLILQEATRIAQVVESLIRFARQQGAGGREPLNLSELAEQVLELQHYALETAGIELRRDLDDDLSPVMGERGALQQVILNLVLNAEQALSAKQGHRLLVVRTRESSEGVLLSVVDNGPGIHRELLPRLFDSYGSGHAQGNGLGLGVSATIIREHGGQIMAESEAGRGAAFFVRLPRVDRSTAPAAPASAEAPSGPRLERSAAPGPSAPRPDPARTLAEPVALSAPPPIRRSAQPLRVLVADDESTLRLAISLFLGRRGHTVTEAADAHEALRLAREQEFDVALVDARMPGDGLRLLEQLEAMPALRGRTALMTGDLGRARTTQGITTGRPYLMKPFDMNEALSLIERLGGGAR